jgi:hypothetical protein
VHKGPLRDGQFHRHFTPRRAERQDVGAAAKAHLGSRHVAVPAPRRFHERHGFTGPSGGNTDLPQVLSETYVHVRDDERAGELVPSPPSDTHKSPGQEGFRGRIRLNWKLSANVLPHICRGRL